MSVRLKPVDGNDLLELLVDVESAFAIHLPGTAYGDCRTIGDVFDLVWETMPAQHKSGGKCPTLISFNLLKSGVKSASRPSPDTTLRELPGFSYIALQRKLRREGWRMPQRQTQPAGLILGSISALALAIWLYPAIGAGAIALAFVVWITSMVTLHKYVFTAGYPQDAKNLGELARQVCDRNAEQLLARGATFSRKALWQYFEGQLMELRGESVRLDRDSPIA